MTYVTLTLVRSVTNYIYMILGYCITLCHSVRLQNSASEKSHVSKNREQICSPCRSHTLTSLPRAWSFRTHTSDSRKVLQLYINGKCEED